MMKQTLAVLAGLWLTTLLSVTWYSQWDMQFPLWFGLLLGLSGALLEAMACGLACIVTRIGGNIDVVTDGRTGILYEPGKPDELCAAIERMIGDQSLRRQLGQNARSFAEQKTSVENITQRYMELYKNVWNLRLV